MIDILFDATTRKPVSVAPVSEKPSLAQQLAQAQEREDDFTLEQVERAVRAPLCNYLMTKKEVDELLALVQPLVDFFPGPCEYDIYTSSQYPKEMKSKKAQLNPALAVPREVISVLNPGVVMSSEAQRDYDLGSDSSILDLSDADYEDLLQAAEELSGIWGSVRDCTPAELVKNLILTEVMRDERVRSLVFSNARRHVSELLSGVEPLAQWRNNH